MEVEPAMGGVVLTSGSDLYTTRSNGLGVVGASQRPELSMEMGVCLG